jgi:sensor histidine kinase YesM
MEFLNEFSTVQKKNSLSFPIIFEILIWVFYVAFYKYSYHIDHAGLPKVHRQNFPYIEICAYSIVSTLYIIPYYRWAVPKLLYQKRYLWLILLTIVYFVFLTTYNNIAVAWVFAKLTQGKPVNYFFHVESAGYFIDWNMIMTDFIAFLSIAFSRFSYTNELQRHRVETDHLNLQLVMLKNQLQPHFLFNTLNSLYGMSLTASKETPRFILLLSQMMQYILYDCDQPTVSLKGEVDFLSGYFELEQKKFPEANISFNATSVPAQLQLPPLLLLPLVENSFKHGKHKLENNSFVQADLTINEHSLSFTISNETLADNPFQQQKMPGGIGLVNIKKRLALYYPDKHELILTEHDHIFTAKLTITL